jgi:hypothetical protein
MHLKKRGHAERSRSHRRLLAQALLALRRVDEALAHYGKIATSGTPDSTAHLVLGLRAMMTGEWEGGAHHLKRAAEAEPDCTVCKEALKQVEVAKVAHQDNLEARRLQQKALEEMKVPVMCLGYLAVTTAGAMISGGVLNPQLVSRLREGAWA